VRRTAVRCAINLGPEPRTLKNAALLAGEVLYGGLQGDVLPGFGAIVSRITG
jgi:hypothetical protein